MSAPGQMTDPGLLATVQKEKGTPEDEMAGWHHRLDGCESDTVHILLKPGLENFVRQDEA